MLFMWQIESLRKKLLKHVLRIYNSWKHLFQEEKTTKTFSKH